MHFQDESKEEQAARQLVLQDIGQILAMFMGRRQYDFGSFRACWEQLDFSLVHAVKPDYVSRAWFYECLFDETVEQLFLTDSLMWRVGVIYLLYMLHQSQPLGMRRFPIFVSKRSWEIILELWQASLAGDESNKLGDLKVILATLKRKNGFCLVAMTKRECIDAHRIYKQALLEETNPGEAIVEVEKEIQRIREGLDESFSGIPGRMQTEALQALEDIYVKQKEAVSYAFRDQQRLHIIRQNLSKDLSQAQIDWERLRMTTDTTETTKQGTKKRKVAASGRVSPVDSVASSSSKGGARRISRPSTAPPSTTNIMQNVEDMPPII